MSPKQYYCQSHQLVNTRNCLSHHSWPPKHILLNKVMLASQYLQLCLFVPHCNVLYPSFRPSKASSNAFRSIQNQFTKGPSSSSSSGSQFPSVPSPRSPEVASPRAYPQALCQGVPAPNRDPSLPFPTFQCSPSCASGLTAFALPARTHS